MTPGKNSDPTRKHCNHIIILTNPYCLKLKPNSTIHIFTFMHLADAFIQSDLHCIQVFTFYQLLLSLGIKHMILALLAPCIYIYIVISWIPGIMGPVPYTHLHRSRCQLSGSAQSHAAGFCAESPLRTGPADPCCRTAGFTTLMT